MRSVVLASQQSSRTRAAVSILSPRRRTLTESLVTSVHLMYVYRLDVAALQCSLRHPPKAVVEFSPHALLPGILGPLLCSHSDAREPQLLEDPENHGDLLRRTCQGASSSYHVLARVRHAWSDGHLSSAGLRVHYTAQQQLRHEEPEHQAARRLTRGLAASRSSVNTSSGSPVSMSNTTCKLPRWWHRHISLKGKGQPPTSPLHPLQHHGFHLAADLHRRNRCCLQDLGRDMLCSKHRSALCSFWIHHLELLQGCSAGIVRYIRMWLAALGNLESLQTLQMTMSKL